MKFNNHEEEEAAGLEEEELERMMLNKLVEGGLLVEVAPGEVEADEEVADEDEAEGVL